MLIGSNLRLLPTHSQLVMVGLPHALDLAVHLVNFFGWMSQGGHSEPLLLLPLFYQSTPFCLKVIGWWGGVGGPCDFSVSPSPFGLDFGNLDFGTSDLGLTIFIFLSPVTLRSLSDLILVSLSI